MCCQVEVSASGRSLVQWSPTEYSVSEHHREASILRRPWPTVGCYAMVKKKCDCYCWFHTVVWLFVVGFMLLCGGDGCRFCAGCGVVRH